MLPFCREAGIGVLGRRLRRDVRCPCPRRVKKKRRFFRICVHGRGRRIRTLNKGFGDPRVTITPCPYDRWSTFAIIANRTRFVKRKFAEVFSFHPLLRRFSSPRALRTAQKMLESDEMMWYEPGFPGYATRALRRRESPHGQTGKAEKHEYHHAVHWFHRRCTAVYAAGEGTEEARP